MPPHCDSLDGPVVTAARQALEVGSVNLVLGYVPSDAEDKLRAVFDLASKARTQGPEAKDAADRLFFETAVRLHRAGEGEPFTGLEPAGLDPGPAVTLAEEAIRRGSPEHLVRLLADAVTTEADHKFKRMWELEAGAERDVAGAREYVAAELGFISWATRVHRCILSAAHEGC